MGINAGNISVSFFNSSVALDSLKKNITLSKTIAVFIKEDEKLTQPYWLENQMEKGSFNVSDQQLIGKAENNPLSADFKVNIEGTDFTFTKPIRYKFTDPVKGEIYQPVSIVPAVEIKYDKDIYIVKGNDPFKAEISLIPKINDSLKYRIFAKIPDKSSSHSWDNRVDIKGITKDKIILQSLFVSNSNLEKEGVVNLISSIDKLSVPVSEISKGYGQKINYDHIPVIVYQKNATAKSVFLDLKSNGKFIGYIPGAGDKVTQALEQMGYKVTTLKEADINSNNLKQFDAIITGVRAYNTNEWMGNVHETLMQYV